MILPTVHVCQNPIFFSHLCLSPPDACHTTSRHGAVQILILDCGVVAVGLSLSVNARIEWSLGRLREPQDFLNPEVQRHTPKSPAASSVACPDPSDPIDSAGSRLHASDAMLRSHGDVNVGHLAGAIKAGIGSPWARIKSSPKPRGAAFAG